MRLEIKVIPSSSQRKIIPYGEKLKAYLRSSPEKGKANKELISLVSEEFNVRANDVVIIKGRTSPYKVLEIRRSSR